jgi:Rho GTPase-activating protein RGD1
MSSPQLPPIPAHNDRAYTNANVPNNVPTPSADKSRPTFGIDLAEQMIRDNCDVPPIMRKCCEAIETYGMTSQGIYRLSGTTSKVAKLKERLDKGSFASCLLCDSHC